MPTTMILEARALRPRVPVELIVFGLAMASVLALVLAPHRIGIGF